MGRFSLMGAPGAVVGMDFSGVVSLPSERRSGVTTAGVLYRLVLFTCASMGQNLMGVVGGVDILM